METIENKIDSLDANNKITVKQSELFLARIGYLELQRLELKAKIKSSKGAICVTSLPSGNSLYTEFSALNDEAKSQVILLSHLSVVEGLIEDIRKEYRKALHHSSEEYVREGQGKLF